MTLVLQAGQILAVNSAATVNWLWNMWGCEIAAGVPQYKVLAVGGPLPAVSSWQNIYQVPTGRMTLVAGMSFLQYPVLTTAQGLLLGTGGNGYLANSISVPGGGYASYDEGGWHMFDNAGRRLG